MACEYHTEVAEILMKDPRIKVDAPVRLKSIIFIGLFIFDRFHLHFQETQQHF